MSCQANKAKWIADRARAALLVLLRAALCLLSPTSCLAAEYVQKQGSAVVQFEADKDETGRLKLRLSDAIHLTVRVEDGAALEVQPIPAITTSADWQAKPESVPERIALAAGHFRWQQRFRLSPLKPGELSLVLAPLRFRVSQDPDRWEEVAWQPIPVQVSTEVYRAEISELHDITPPEEPPPAPSGGIHPSGAVLAVVCFLLVLSGWALFRRRRQESALSSSQWALRELQQIHPPAESTQVGLEEFYTRLSDILRRYLELRFHFPAPEQTTIEFLEAIGRSPQLQPEQQTVLRTFLEQCDLVKFARVQPSEEECRKSAEKARAFVEQTATDGVSRSDFVASTTDPGRR